MDIETVTFLLALAAYLCLAVAAILAAHGVNSPGLSIVVIILALSHVVLVWWFRYEWSLSEATRNGYFGFGIFHTALALIVAVPMVQTKISRLLSRLSFLVVTVGANGAVWRYDEVAMYRYPVLMIGLVGVALVLACAFKKRSSS